MLIKTKTFISAIENLKTNLEHLSFEKIDNNLFLTKSMLTHQVQQKIILDESTDANAKTMIDATKLTKICKLIKKNNDIEILISKHSVSIEAGKAKFTLKSSAGIDAIETSSEIKHVLIYDDLCAVLKNIKFAPAKADVRSYLNAFLLDVTATGHFLIATDGHRLIKQKLTLTNDYIGVPFDCVISREAINDILNLNSTVTLTVFTDNSIQLVAVDCSIIVKNMCCRYVNYRSVIPTINADFFIDINDVKNFKNDMINLKYLAEKKRYKCMLAYSDNKLTCTINDADSIVVDCECNGEFKYAFNIKYIIDQLANTIISDNKIQLEIFVDKNNIGATLVTRSESQILVTRGLV